MAWTFSLTDGTNTLDLNDGTSFKILQNGFSAPAPMLRTTFAGRGNPSRSGERLMRGVQHENRNVRVRLQIGGTSTDVLATNIQTLEAQLRRASEFSAFGIGAQMQLKLQWDSATNAVFFNVIAGRFDPIGAGSHNSALVGQTQLVGRDLDLICEPYAVGTEETIENHLRDANFEIAGTALADWTASSDATGSDDRDTTRFIWVSSLKLDVTDSTSGGQKQSRYQDRTAAAADVWSVSAYIEANDITAAIIFVLHMQFRNATTALYEQEEFLETALVGTFTQLSMVNIKAAPTGTTLIRFWVEARATDVDANGTCYVAQCMAVKATTIPTAWASGREIMNHFDDDGQLHVNYLDIEDVPGDIPALLQLKATENEAHTAFWCGARHAGRQRDAGLFHEGEDFGTWDSEPTSGSPSGGAFGERVSVATYDAASSGVTEDTTTLTVAHTCTTQGDRLLVVSVAVWDTVETTPTGVTYAGVAMTMQGSMIRTDDSRVGLTTWTLVAPATGTNNIIATFATNGSDIILGGDSFYGVDQVTPVGTHATNKSGGTVVTVNIVTSLGDMVVYASTLSLRTPTSTTGSGQTERWDVSGLTGSALSAQGSTERSDTSTMAMTNTWSSSDDWAAAGLAVKPVTAASPTVLTLGITTPPRGVYQVLARCAENGTSADIRLGIGYSYGDITETPSVAANYTALNGSSFHIVDIGTLIIPPLEQPTNATIGTYTLRLAYYDDANVDSDRKLQVDYVWLVPVDFGSGFISSKATGADVVFVDGRSELRALALLNSSSVIQSYPDAQGGDPPQVHPEGTRLSFASVDATFADIADGWTMSITYLPRYLSVAGT